MADTQPTHKLYYIMDSTLASMASSAAFTNEFPFLKGLNVPAKRKGGCGRCGGGNTSLHASVYQAAKRVLAGMSDDKKRKLKTLLNAKQVRITYRQDNGRTVELTF